MTLTSQNVRHGRLTNAKLAGQRSLGNSPGSVPCPDLPCLLHGQLADAVVVKARRAPVSCLLPGGAPLHFARSVRPVVIDPVECQAWRARPYGCLNIRDEHGRVMPLRADEDPAPAVSLIVPANGTLTAVKHQLPCPVKRMIRQTVSLGRATHPGSGLTGEAAAGKRRAIRPEKLMNESVIDSPAVASQASSAVRTTGLARRYPYLGDDNPAAESLTFTDAVFYRHPLMISEAENAIYPGGLIVPGERLTFP